MYPVDHIVGDAESYLYAIDIGDGKGTRGGRHEASHIDTPVENVAREWSPQAGVNQEQPGLAERRPGIVHCGLSGIESGPSLLVVRLGETLRRIKGLGSPG